MNKVLKMHWRDYYHYLDLHHKDCKMSNSRNGIELEYCQTIEGNTHYSYKIINQELFTIFLLTHGSILTRSKIIEDE